MAPLPTPKEEYQAARLFATQFVLEAEGQEESAAWMQAWAQVAEDVDLFDSADRCFEKACETLFALGYHGGYLAGLRESAQQAADLKKQVAEERADLAAIDAADEEPDPPALAA